MSMKSGIVILLFAGAGLVWTTPTAAQSSGGPAQHRARMKRDVRVNKYLRISGGSMRGWKDKNLWRAVYTCGGSWYCTHSWNVILGKSSAQLRSYYTDALHTYLWNGRPKFTLSFIHRGIQKGLAIKALLHGVPGLADRLAPTIDSNKEIHWLWGSNAGDVYWSLFYLGAKNKLPAMFSGLSEVRLSANHVRAIYGFSYAWKLSKAQVRKLETLCTAKVFGPGKYKVAEANCLRWLGRTTTRNKLAQRFVRKYVTSSYSVPQAEAIRAAGALRLKAAKRKLQDNLAKAYAKRTRLVKRGRRYKRVKSDTWSTNWNAVPSAVALLGLGDRQAKKAIGHWTQIDRKTGRCNHTAIEHLFVEAVFAHPRAQKKLNRTLKKLYKKMVKLQRKNRTLRGTVRRAALALLQMGDRAGLKVALQVLTDGDRGNVGDLLSGLGANPHGWVGPAGNRAGLGHITVGKGGLKTRDAQKLANKIKAEFPMWNDKGLRAKALQAWTDINTRIGIANKKL
jgi:hypothetical protein